MLEDHPKPDKSWRQIAEEAATEGDSDKLLELSRELVEALDEQTNHQPQQTPESAEKRERRNVA